MSRQDEPVPAKVHLMRSSKNISNISKITLKVLGQFDEKISIMSDFFAFEGDWLRK